MSARTPICASWAGTDPAAAAPGAVDRLPALDVCRPVTRWETLGGWLLRRITVLLPRGCIAGSFCTFRRMHVRFSGRDSLPWSDSRSPSLRRGPRGSHPVISSRSRPRRTALRRWSGGGTTRSCSARRPALSGYGSPHMAKLLRIPAAPICIGSPEPGPICPPGCPGPAGGSPVPPWRWRRTPTSSWMKSSVSAPSMTCGRARQHTHQLEMLNSILNSFTVVAGQGKCQAE